MDTVNSRRAYKKSAAHFSAELARVTLGAGGTGPVAVHPGAVVDAREWPRLLRPGVGVVDHDCVTDAPAPLDPDPRTADEREMLLGFLRRQRETVLRVAEGLTDEQARWTPPGRLTPIIAILNHLPYVEWRWIDGRFLGEEVSRSEEIEFQVPPARQLDDVIADYRTRAARTEEIVRGASGVEAECLGHPSQPPRPGLNLRWVLLHLIEETAHHAGHADATREMLDGTTIW